MDKLILVLYFDVDGVPQDLVEKYVKEVSSKMFPSEVIQKLDATLFVIPRIGGGTRLESINPTFILDQDVYREYRLKLDVLNENLNDFITESKK